MLRAASGVPLLILWFVTSLAAILAFQVIVPNTLQFTGINQVVSSSSKNIYNEPKHMLSDSERQVLIATKVGASDGRVAVVDKFLAKYDSPMTGHGKEFVAAADYYEIDWRLLPAIAFQESNLGKRIPKGSYNPFGWAIYTGKNHGVYFENWPDSIFTVASGIRKYYLDHGLATPKDIAIKYTKNANPSWVFAVETAMNELSGAVY